MSKVIIGIHGLANKPEPTVLAGAWKNALIEGLGYAGKQIQEAELDFRMVHWAHYLYKYPLHRDDVFSFDPYYNKEPYRPAAPGTVKEHKDGWWDTIRSASLGVLGTTGDFVRSRLKDDRFAKWLLGSLLKDLEFYYANHQVSDGAGGKAPAQTVLKDALKKVILEAQGSEIMLIAHSMGTIIGYNALRDLGRPPHQNVSVDHFVTIGSPLGLPYVRDQIVKERTYDPRVRTPSIVKKSWINYADPLDPVAADVHLRDDYSENAIGIRVVDDLVCNDYFTTDEKGEIKHNHHKSYGYLRTPELSAQVKAFLGTEDDS